VRAVPALDSEPKPGWRLSKPLASTPPWWAFAAVVVLLVGTSARLWIASRQVESPGIDENEVVEQAVAFMGDDHSYHFLKYGPLTMYVLAGIYHVMALLHGSTALDYASRVFFEGSEHYLIARLYVVGWLTVLAVYAFLVFRRQSGPGPALLASSLLAFPVVEVLAPGARIDIPQAAFQGMALLALSEVVRTRQLRHWLIAGACAGLAIATKPLPGLLVIPCFVAAAGFASKPEPDAAPRSLPTRLLATFAGRGLWLAALACIALALLGNPAMLDIQTFVQSQRDAVALHSGNTLHARSNVLSSLSRLQLPLLAAALGSGVLALLRRDARGVLYGLFIVVYLGALWGRASRDYFLVAPAVAACLLIGVGWARLGELAALARFRRWEPYAWAAAAALLIALPAQVAWGRAAKPNGSTLARQWIFEHVPSGSRLFHVGWRPSGPQLITTDEKVEARWGDHFDYGRSQYPFLRKAFHLGFANYMASDKPRYDIRVHDGLPYPRATKRTPRAITDRLLRQAQKDKVSYIILAGYRESSWRELGYPWFADAVFEQEFHKIAIFRVPDPGPVVQTSTPAPPDPSPTPAP
jgi:dolichyl-phosphate-mannose-protein mannosyltransferase